MRIAALSAAAFLVALGTHGAARSTPSDPCGTRAGQTPVVSHVIWIWFENHSAADIVGNRKAPYLNSLARSCGLATNYRALTHPSLPNYIAATSGDTQGVDDDDAPSAHRLTGASLFDQAPSAGSYEESMPARCDPHASYPYAPRHNPEAYFVRARKRCRAGDVRLGTTTNGPLASALAGGTLPAFSFVTPNLCHDMHDCSVTTGDAWLKRWLPKITSSPGYRVGNTVVFVAWDEDDGSAANRVPLFVVSPWTKPGTRSTTRFTLYSLLRTTEELLGLRTLLGHAATAPSLRPAFGL